MADKRQKTMVNGSQIKSTLYAVFCVFLVTCDWSLVTCYAASTKKPVQITAKVDKDKVNIGDRIKLEVKAKNAAPEDVIFPDKPENLGDFTLYDSSVPKKRSSRADEAVHVYVVGIYSTGSHVIYPIPVKYRANQTGDWTTVMSPQVPIQVEPLLTAEYTDICGLKGLVSLRSGAALRSLIIVILIFILALGLYVWKTGRLPMFPRDVPPPKPAEEVAYERLAHLKTEDLPGKGRVKEYYIELSDIIREYIENRFALRAPEMTTEEFLESIKTSRELIGSTREILEAFLAQCDMVKFAKYGPTLLEMLDSFKAAEKFVDETRPVEEEVTPDDVR